jgi:hypothetical protein
MMRVSLRYFLRYFLLPVAAMAIMTGSCAAWENVEEEETIKSAPHCTLTPPSGIASKSYLWPKLDLSAAGGEKGKELFYCHGLTPETESIIHVWPAWQYVAKEHSSFPFEFINTAGGVLTMWPGEIPPLALMLNGQPFVGNLFSARIEQAYPEKQGNPQVVIVNFEPYGGDTLSGRHIVDFGVSPPFVSPVELLLGIYSDVRAATFRNRPERPEAHITIVKIEKDIYEVSGQFLDMQSRRWTESAYRYNRKKHSVRPITK